MAENRVTRRIKQGRVDVDYEDSALIVNYEIETVEVDSRGNAVEVLERKPEIRRLKIKSLAADKNMAQLANDIIDKCKYIHGSRAEEIEGLLIKLKKYHLTSAAPIGDGGPTNEDHDLRDRAALGAKSDTNSQKRSSSTKRNRDQNSEDVNGGCDSSQARSQPSKPKGDNLPAADISQLDDYLDMLYQVSGKSDREKEEGLRVQERGTAMILKLCRDVMNLEQLIQNSTVMGAITRVLQEEYKKSIDLTFNILRIFLAFSNFMEMHALMSNYRIGVLTMKAIEFEVKRSELREAERLEREQALNEELQAAKDNLLEYPKVLERVKKLKEKEASKQKQFIRKQDRLLFVGFYILLNLAEDATVERKMIKKGLIPSLLAMLGHSYEHLLVLAVTFLKKLSIFEENKDAFKDCAIVEQVAKFVPCSSNDLVLVTLRLLFNLSFDKDLRDQMLKGGYIPKLIILLKTPIYRAKTLKLLYHLSVDDRCKSMITYTDGIPMLMGLVLNFPQDMLAKELAALMINLSYYPRNVEMMLNNKGLNLLMDRFADKRDTLLLKVIRNISLYTYTVQQEGGAADGNYRFRGLWSPHVRTLLEVMLEEKNHDQVIEIVGCLANLTAYDLPSTFNWSKMLRDHGLLSFFARNLVPGLAQNDLVLEIVMLAGTIATDPQACEILASGNLVPAFYQLLKEKGEDVEILLQLLTVFHRFMFSPNSREAAIYNTRIFANIVECLDHSNASVRVKAEEMSDIVLEFDRKLGGELGAMGNQILKRRFETYNKTWLQAMGGMQGLIASHYYEAEEDDSGLGYGMGSTDHLPTAQDHDLSMITAARYTDDPDEHAPWRRESKGGGRGGGSYDDDEEDEEYQSWHK